MVNHSFLHLCIHLPIHSFVMTISVISVSSASSEESVGTSTRQVILFGTIPDTTPFVILPTTHIATTPIPTISPTIPPSPDYTPTSPDYSPASDTEFIHLRTRHQIIYRHYQLLHHFFYRPMIL
ncbi:hypothetical protein Tco_1404397 [Tanacetum coccineum]